MSRYLYRYMGTSSVFFYWKSKQWLIYSVVKITLKFNCINVTHVICFELFKNPLNWIVTNSVWVFSRLFYFLFCHILECVEKWIAAASRLKTIFLSLIGEIYVTSLLSVIQLKNNYFNFFVNTFKQTKKSLIVLLTLSYIDIRW